MEFPLNEVSLSKWNFRDEETLNLDKKGEFHLVDKACSKGDIENSSVTVSPMASFTDIIEEPYSGSYLEMLNLNLPFGTGMERCSFTSIGGNAEKTLGEVQVEEAPAKKIENSKPVTPLLLGVSCSIYATQELQPGLQMPAASLVMRKSLAESQRRTRRRRRAPTKSGLKLGKIEVQDRPEWLPPDWEMERRVRGSGTTIGMVDTFYYDPIKHRQFRSKTEVLSFLITGVRERRKKKSNDNSGFANMMPLNISGRNGSTSKRKKRSDSNFNFTNLPEKASRVLNPVVGSGSWTPSLGIETTPKLPRQDLNAAFTFLTEVGESNPKVAAV